MLLLFLSLQVFYSPQWLLWLLPLLVPLAAGNRWLFGLVVAFDLVTYFTFPVVYDAGVAFLVSVLAGALVFARMGLTLGLFGVLARKEYQAIRKNDEALLIQKRASGKLTLASVLVVILCFVNMRSDAGVMLVNQGLLSFLSTEEGT